MYISIYTCICIYTYITYVYIYTHSMSCYTHVVLDPLVFVTPWKVEMTNKKKVRHRYFPGGLGLEGATSMVLPNKKNGGGGGDVKTFSVHEASLAALLYSG